MDNNNIIESLKAKLNLLTETMQGIASDIGSLDKSTVTPLEKQQMAEQMKKLAAVFVNMAKNNQKINETL